MVLFFYGYGIIKGLKVNFMNKFKKVMPNGRHGFTLIELLVVVAIIAIIVSVTLVSLNNSRNKGADAAVKSNLGTIRGQSELFYSNNDNKFLPAGGSTFGVATCPTYNALGTNMLSKDKTISDAIAEAIKRGTNGNSCYNSSLYWAIAIGLKSNANRSWCVDSGGGSKEVATIPAGAINGTDFSCN